MGGSHTCGACGLTIEVCENCGGKLCSEGCPDRGTDGCTCATEAAAK